MKNSQNKKNYLDNNKLRTIYNQMKNSVCIIKCSNEGFGTGFFCKIPEFYNKDSSNKSNTNYLVVLVTSDNIITENDIVNKKTIELSLDANSKKIEILIDESRKTFTSKKYNITIIEIKENDKINDNLIIDVDEQIYRLEKDILNNYREKKVYLLHYPYGKIKNNIGKIKNINESDNDINIFEYICQTSSGSIGCPIINLDNNKLIGIHLDSLKNDLNLGLLFKEPFQKYFEKYNNLYPDLLQKEKNLEIENKKNFDTSNNVKTIIKEDEAIKDEIKITYKFKDNSNNIVRIFGAKFVKRNKDLKIGFNIDEYEIEYEICSYINKNNLKKTNKNYYEIKLKGLSNITDISYMFSSCDSIINIYGMDDFNTKNITDMNNMFSNCISLEYLPNISKWDVSNVTNMSYLFHYCESLISVSYIYDWNVKNLTNMECMFSGCKNITGLSETTRWNTKNVKKMGSLFSDCSSIEILCFIENWNTENVNDMSFMFNDCKSIYHFPDLSKWNTKNVVDMSYLFSGTSADKLPDISNWNTQNVTDMSSMFSGCKLLKSLPDISKWNTSNVTRMDEMFKECKMINKLPDISLWNTENVISMNEMFCCCFSLQNLPEISNWNTGKVENMGGIFKSCMLLKTLPDLSKWNMENVKDMNSMFKKCFGLENLPDISNWNLKSVENMNEMFSGTEKIVIPSKFFKYQ